MFVHFHRTAHWSIEDVELRSRWGAREPQSRDGSLGHVYIAACIFSRACTTYVQREWNT
jgi:hypothetical protein